MKELKNLKELHDPEKGATKKANEEERYKEITELRDEIKYIQFEDKTVPVSNEENK
ncbi:hypothetical protein [Anaeromicrobium sediminis]|uniref:hypothetical protein n=1 Tax=Anaeromicrobium sediminis TaxID=1478221 RepID=UPI0015951E7B|nr:hypothetical protein [Anaeromicrobium sediminis]